MAAWMLALSGAAILVGAAAAAHELRLALRELPLHVALRRFEVDPAADALRAAEVRCAGCRLRKSCMRGLVRYQDLPAECPNGALFARNLAPYQAARRRGA